MNTILEVRQLKKYFKTSAGLLHAVDDVSFTLETGKTLGVVGESGCGKSTLGRTIVHLLEPTDGQILFEGNDITNVKGRQLKELRHDMQMIFQDPFSSLNPRMTVSETIEEPLIIYGIYKAGADRNRRVNEVMEKVGLAQRLVNSYPHELDGGRRQRIGVARALALNPKFIICDEPVSSLDVSIQAQILNLLQDLQRELNLTYIFITHDLSVVRHISDEIIVMYLGNMVEYCPSKEVFTRTLHPYSQALLSAIPVPNIHVKKERIILKGEITSPITPKPGCRFAPRCMYAREKCFTDTPDLKQALPDHYAACHYPIEVNRT